MIQNIKIKSLNPFDNEIKTIEFGRVNTIIGPKGGGKSTLFDLLANLSNQTYLSTVEDALSKHQIELVSVTVDGEEIPVHGLNKTKLTAKQKDAHYEGRMDVVYQDDPIKKNLSSDQSFDKGKLDFAKELTFESKDPVKFISTMKTLYDSIYKVVLKDTAVINWANALDMAQPSEDDEKVIFDLNYNDAQLRHIIASDRAEIKAIADNVKDQINYYKNLVMTVEESTKTSEISVDFSMAIIEKSNEILAKLREMADPISKENHRLSKITKIITAFGEAYREKVAQIKRTALNTSSLTAYESNSKNHFEEMAKLLKKASFAFDDIVNAEIKLDLNDKKEVENMLQLSISEVIVLDQEEKYDLLKKVLHNARKVQEDVENWIDAARNNSDKGFKSELITNHLASKIVKDKIKVLADGKDYETMSLGQKSIYGIKYKFNHAKGKPIFLDQPEDNLDNETIATNILDLINEKEEQVFIVTHNANTGILTKPDRVIVANFQDKEEAQTLDQYQVGTVRVTNGDSHSAKYLEGGLKFIQERLEIIKGDK